MANGWDSSGRTLASLQRGDALQFRCGNCGRKGQVTVTELRFRRIPYCTPIDEMVGKVVCKRCGCKSVKTTVWARSGR